MWVSVESGRQIQTAQKQHSTSSANHRPIITQSAATAASRNVILPVYSSVFNIYVV